MSSSNLCEHALTYFGHSLGQVALIQWRVSALDISPEGMHVLLSELHHPYRPRLPGSSNSPLIIASTLGALRGMQRGRRHQGRDTALGRRGSGDERELERWVGRSVRASWWWVGEAFAGVGLGLKRRI